MKDIAKISLWFTSLFSLSCSSSRLFSGHSVPSTLDSVDINESETLTVLSLVGGLCLLAGMALLVVTSGKRGWYPVIGGIILVVLNYAVARYDDLIFYPLVICTGLISAAWTFKTVRTLLKEKRMHNADRRTD